MRIDSATIGMESARSYTSVSRRVSKFTITNGKQSLEDGTNSLLGNLFQGTTEGEETQTEDKEKPENSLKASLEDMTAKLQAVRTGRIQKIDVFEAREQLMEIRQQCLNYLMELFFPERKSSAWEKYTGLSESVSATTGNLISSLGVGTKTFAYSTQYYHEEMETTGFSTQGTVKCADGREINFNLNVEMSRSFQEYYEENVSYTQVALCDPLVINLNGNIADLSDQTFFFDLDGDGQEDEINRLAAGSGFLALDKNEDGVINDGSELFGTKSGDGFADLAAYDSDHNGFIDENDEIWSKLKIWTMDENGNKQLYSLADQGVGAICLQNAATDFSITDKDNGVNGMVRRTGIFLYENGNVGTLQHVDMALHEQKEQEKAPKEYGKYEQWLYNMV